MKSRKFIRKRKWGKKCESHNHPPIKDLILKANGIKAITPLSFTCLKGNLEIVKRVVEVWGADVNQAGNQVILNQPYGQMDKITRRFDGVTPLFAAALKKKKT